MSTTQNSVVDKVHSHRDELETLAESDLRCAQYARELLALADENGGGH